MNSERIYLSPPHMSELELELITDAFKSNWIAPLGPHVDKFEDEISNYLNVNAACALSSGTAALHLALKVLGVKENDHVLCPSLTFAASANAILYEKAIPIFVDVSKKTWTIDPEQLSVAIKKYNPKALITVDIYGQSADYDVIIEICKQNNVIVIEDAAESLGSEYKDKKCGSFGSIGILSFNGNKIITTSGGGMLVSNNQELVDKARFLSTQAREPVIHYEHKELGYNYIMSNLLAAVGRGQLQVLDQRVSDRRKIFNNYADSLSHIEGIEFMEEAEYGRMNRWLTTLLIDPNKTGITNLDIIKALKNESIESRPVWKPMHMQPLFKDYPYVSMDRGDISRFLFENGLCLPSGSNLSVKDQGRVINIILSKLKSN
ncbi:pyridoxal phosphate-dependent aminotransferase [bacterium]|nr:pyridoxal phosphate-dependent aminotransferase [bacterium]